MSKLKTLIAVAALAMVFSAVAKAGDCRPTADTNNYSLYNGEAFTQLLARCTAVYGKTLDEQPCQNEVYLRAAAWGYCLRSDDHGRSKFQENCSYDDLDTLITLVVNTVSMPVPVPKFGAQVCISSAGCEGR